MPDRAPAGATGVLYSGRGKDGRYLLEPDAPLNPPDLKALGILRSDAQRKAMIVAAYYATRLMPMPQAVPQTKMRWVPALLERGGDPSDPDDIRYGWGEVAPDVRVQVYDQLRAANPDLPLPETPPKVHVKVHGTPARNYYTR